MDAGGLLVSVGARVSAMAVRLLSDQWAFLEGTVTSIAFDRPEPQSHALRDGQIESLGLTDLRECQLIFSDCSIRSLASGSTQRISMFALFPDGTSVGGDENAATLSPGSLAIVDIALLDRRGLPIRAPRGEISIASQNVTMTLRQDDAGCVETLLPAGTHLVFADVPSFASREVTVSTESDRLEFVLKEGEVAFEPRAPGACSP